MPNKRSRSQSDKIEAALASVGNLHPTLVDSMRKELITSFVVNNVSKMKIYISEKLKLPESGKQTIQYWISRGWTEPESRVKSKQSNKRKPTHSPFSKDFWMNKINPLTGEYYTEDESDFQRNSRRPIRSEYWILLGHTKEESDLLAKQQKDHNNKKGASVIKDYDYPRYNSHRCIEYWMVRGYSEEEAKQNISKLQTTFSLEICVDKFGQEEGRKIWLDRQEKWHNNYKKSNFSKISQELFWAITQHLSDMQNIHFAQLNECKLCDTSGRNHEYRLKLTRMILPDFIDTSKKKIIEFDGAYWHGIVGRGNKSRDADRDAMIIDAGYSLLRIDEKKYYNDKSGVVKQCLDFLTQ